MALWLDIDEGQELVVGENAVIHLVKKSGRRARLKIEGTAVVELRTRSTEGQGTLAFAAAEDAGDGRRR